MAGIGNRNNACRLLNTTHSHTRKVGWARAAHPRRHQRVGAVGRAHEREAAEPSTLSMMVLWRCDTSICASRLPSERPLITMLGLRASASYT